MAAENAASGDRPTPVIRRTSDAGLSGSHAVSDLADVPVATATAQERNTIVLPLRPVGCWSMGDVRFAFDSSFIAPTAADEFSLLTNVREEHKEIVQNEAVYPPLSLFGHADPVGQDEYNKQLAGRRVRAVYAALIRDTTEWEKLYSQPLSTDNWGIRSIQTMLSELGWFSGDPTGTLDADTRTAVRDFQQAEGLSVDGDPGPQTRSRLFERYMDHLCGSDLRLSRTEDFLARGVDHGGKGDYQGCSEFNPVLMFSSAENEQLNQPEQKSERNAQNAPNRRVLALLFAPGRKVNPAKWPCPRATEGTAGCRRRFWSDAAARRSFQSQRRLYEVTHDTFACRFYDLFVFGSPCERALAVLRVRLHDLRGRKMPGVQYRLEYGGSTKSGRADQDGFVSDVLDPGAEVCTVRWELATGSPQDGGSESDRNFVHELDVFVALQDFETEEGLKRRLHNLGYRYERDLEANLRGFQSDHELEITGEADDATKEKLRSIYGNALDETVEPEDVPPVSASESEQRT